MAKRKPKPDFEGRRRFLKVASLSFLPAFLKGDRASVRGAKKRSPVTGAKRVSPVVKNHEHMTRNFENARAQITNFLRENAHELIVEGHKTDFERGGILYLSDGKMKLEWVEDPELKKVKSLYSQVAHGDPKKINLVDYDALTRVLTHKADQTGVSGMTGVEMKDRLVKFRRVIEMHANGQIPSAAVPQLKGVYKKFNEFLINVGKSYQNTEPAYRRLLKVHEENNNNQLLGMFHTHPEGGTPSPADVSVSKSIFPLLTFALRPNEMRVYYSVNGKTTHAFSTPNPAQ